MGGSCEPPAMVNQVATPVSCHRHTIRSHEREIFRLPLREGYGYLPTGAGLAAAGFAAAWACSPAFIFAITWSRLYEVGN